MQPLDPFTRAYIEAAFWSTTDNADESGGEPLDANYTPEDIDPKTLSQIVDDCRDFQTSFANMLKQSGLSDEQAGHDFWLTREGHGTGFWDRGLGSIGQQLTAMSKPYGPFDLYVADDGMIYH